MATNGEMFSFISNFGPMLGELAATVAYLGERIDRLEAERHAAPAPGGADELGADDNSEIEFMGQKFSVKGMLEGAMPKGGMTELMEKLAKYKRPEATAAATPPTAAPAAEPQPT